MYSTQSRLLLKYLIRTLKNKIYNNMTTILKNVYIDKLDTIFNKYNNTYHSTIKIKPFGLNSGTYIDSNKENNEEYSKLKVSDHVRISKYKNIFAKGYLPKWSEEVFSIKKIKNTVSRIYVIRDLSGEEIVGMFYKKESQKDKLERV